MAELPRSANRMGASTSSDNVVRVWARMSGLTGARGRPELNRRPVKAARPSVAEMPQQSAAEAMKKYPRTGCLFGHELFEAVGVKSDHHFFADHQGRRRAALVFVNEIVDCLRISADITFFVGNPFLRKVALGPIAGWSARLRKEDYGFSHACLESSTHSNGTLFFNPRRFRR
jgi:hypothetical protein